MGVTMDRICTAWTEGETCFIVNRVNFRSINWNQQRRERKIWESFSSLLNN